MTIRFLLDTNTVSEPLRSQPDRAVMARLDSLAGRLAISSAVWHELWYGAERLATSRRRAYIEAFLRDVVAPTLPVLPYDRAAAAWHARERARLQSHGRTPPFVDGQIAAVAATRGLVLVTRNVDDFAGFVDLQVESWFSSAAG